MTYENSSQTAFADGPYLQAAFLCEKVLTEQDGVKSAIRIFDRQTRTTIGPTPPDEMEPYDLEACLLLRFKSGAARGSSQLRVQLQKPSGETSQPVIHTIIFEGEDDRGIDIISNMTLRIEMTGLYWFDIYLEDVRLTRVPLRIVYLPQIRNWLGELHC